MAWLAGKDVNGNGSRMEAITRCCCVLCCATEETGPMHRLPCPAPTWPQRQQRRFPLQLAQSVFTGDAMFCVRVWLVCGHTGRGLGNCGTGEWGEENGHATAQQVSGCDELSSDVSDAVRQGPDARTCASLPSGGQVMVMQSPPRQGQLSILSRRMLGRNLGRHLGINLGRRLGRNWRMTGTWGFVASATQLIGETGQLLAAAGAKWPVGRSGQAEFGEQSGSGLRGGSKAQGARSSKRQNKKQRPSTAQ